jgi:hypothetical protein
MRGSPLWTPWTTLRRGQYCTPIQGQSSVPIDTQLDQDDRQSPPVQRKAAARRVNKFADLAKSEKLHRSYYSQVLRLAYLAPDITAAILEGSQPSGLRATMLIEHPALPLSWQEQRTALGFA